jgi:Tol biopolymer transport system component
MPPPPAATATPLGGGGRIATLDPLWHGRIALIDPDGTDSKQLNTAGWNKLEAPGYTMHPAWSPDGSKIAFAGFPNETEKAIFTQVANPYSTSEIFIVNADGTGLIRLTANRVNDDWPAWSPDGTKIAFASHYQIYIMSQHGTGPTRLTYGDAFDIQPSWSPDGTKIAFSSDRTGNSDIYSMNADGTGVSQLTNDPGTDVRPAWSPDGAEIAFASDRELTFGIYVMKADGSGQIGLPGPGDLLSPAWSPDGEMIAYLSNASGMFCLVRIGWSDATCHFGAAEWLSWSRH